MNLITHSIIIPTKDRPNLLRRAVASALVALGDGGEIIVIDDASITPVESILDLLPNERLRILRHSAPAGASAARNTGISNARGAIIFLLDDDDELMPGYVTKIMSGPAQEYEYGFCCCDKADDAKGHVKKGRRLFRTGPIPAKGSLGKKIFGTGMGVWIKRDIAESIGTFDTKLIVGEDADYACRLIRQGKRAWYSAESGVIIHVHNNVTDQAHIGKSRTIAQAAEDMLLVSLRFPEFSLALGQSYLRLCSKAGQDRQAFDFVRSQQRFALRQWFWIFYGAKRLNYGLKGFIPARR